MKACVNAILKRLELVVHNTPTAMTARAKRKVTVMEAVKTAELAVLFKTAICSWIAGSIEVHITHITQRIFESATLQHLSAHGPASFQLTICVPLSCSQPTLGNQNTAIHDAQ